MVSGAFSDEGNGVLSGYVDVHGWFGFYRRVWCCLIPEADRLELVMRADGIEPWQRSDRDD